MRKISKYVARFLIVVGLGGILGASLVRFSPGYGVDEGELDSRLNQQSIQAIRQAQSSDESLPSFYLHYLGKLLHGDLGDSRALHQPVRQLLATRLPETLKSVGLGLALAWTIGLSLAMVAAMSRSGLADVTASLMANILLCIPAAVLALLFVIAQAPGRLILGLIVFPKVFLYARNCLAESAGLPHVLTARSKGLGDLRILIWHVLPVAAPQLFALAGVSVSLAFAAAIPVEALCDLPGIGQLAWQAALGRDMETLVVLTMIVTMVTLLANGAAELVTRPANGGER